MDTSFTIFYKLLAKPQSKHTSSHFASTPTNETLPGIVFIISSDRDNIILLL
jgi:hypothetical protein